MIFLIISHITDFSFILIFPIVHLIATVLIVETTIREKVVSQFIMIRMIKYFRCVHIHTKLHTHLFIIIIILIKMTTIVPCSSYYLYIH